MVDEPREGAADLPGARTHDVVVLFCGLASLELHLLRVAQRVEAGGHAIAEQKIRERWVASRANLIKLLPHLARLQVFDNSAQAAPGVGGMSCAVQPRRSPLARA